MTKAEIGLIGLGVMGSGLALNIAEKGYPVAVYNRTSSRTGAFFENAGDLRGNIVPCASLRELVAQINPPRPIVLMVQAGKAVDEQIHALRELLAAGDIVIDGGNANFRDTMRRFDELEGSGITFIGMGVSGGATGARHGPSIMVGGSKEAYARVEPILTAIAARYQGEPCSAWLGEGGAGHFVKTIHNGIEYADMQMIAEIYGVLRDGFAMPAAEIGALFAKWNGGRLNSYLVEITAE
ncbi:MAG: NADP-dependent phosphogluconate dehydrogenase, partial [Bauldia sp.]